MIVVDASLAVKWFTNEACSDKAVPILERLLRTPEEFAVPELFFFELANVLYSLSKRDYSRYRDLLESIATLPILRQPFTRELQLEMIPFQQLGLTGYDASYAALAKMLKGTLLTADKKAHSLIKSQRVSELIC